MRTLAYKLMVLPILAAVLYGIALAGALLDLSSARILFDDASAELRRFWES